MIQRRSDVADFLSSFNGVLDTGKRLGDMYIDSKAGQAGRDAQQQQTNTESDYIQQQPDDVYAGEGNDGQMTNAEAASYGLNVPRQDPEAGSGTTRKYGLGKNPSKWQDTEFTDDQKRQAGMRAQMSTYSMAGRNDKAAQLRTQLNDETREGRDSELFGLQKKALLRADKAGDLAEKDAKVERDSDTAAGEFLRKKAVDADGNHIIPSNEDHLGALQIKAQYLAENGHSKGAMQALDTHRRMAMDQIVLQGAQRDEALGRAMTLYAQTNDPSVFSDFYKRFVPDGASGTKFEPSADGKQVTIHRTTADGRDLAPLTMTSQQFANTMMALKNPEKLYQFSQDSIKNSLEERRAATGEKAQVSLSNYHDKMAEAAGTKAGNSSGWRMSEEDKQALTQSFSQIHDAKKTLSAAMTALGANEDPNKNQGVIYAKKMLVEAQQSHLDTQVRTGAITPEDMANRLIGTATTKQDVLDTVTDIGKRHGSKTGDQVMALLGASDEFKALPQGAKKAKGAASSETPSATPLSGIRTTQGNHVVAPEPLDGAGSRERERELLQRMNLPGVSEQAKLGMLMELQQLRQKGPQTGLGMSIQNRQ